MENDDEFVFRMRAVERLIKHNFRCLWIWVSIWATATNK